MTVSQHASHPWLLASRPKTLTASLAPVAVGTGLAAGLSPAGTRWWLALVALLSAGCIQIATNLVNDAADFEKGADTFERLGPTRVTQSGLLRPPQVMLAAGLFFAVAALLGIPLVLSGGLPILVIGLLSIAAGYAYTAGPFPLAYLGLGEVFVILFFGVAAVKGMAYVLAGVSLSPWAELAALQVGLQSATLLAVNNLRDVAGDRKAGKRTLAARFGERFARVEIAALVALPFLLGGLWLLAHKPLAALLPLPTAVLGVRLVGGVWLEAPSRRFNVFLAQSALLQLLFSVLLAIGLALA
jgi:1,4-dihydroxy-2-naphthoate polyprenyltransferase